MVQSHRISTDFVVNSWKECPSLAGIINYHLFRFIVLLSLFYKVKDEVDVLRKQDKERHDELLKLAIRLKDLDNKK